MDERKEQINSWVSFLSKKYGIKLDNRDVHDIFEKYNIPSYTIERNGVDVKHYKTNPVLNLVYNGTLKKEIEKIKNGRNRFNRLRSLPKGYGKTEIEDVPKKRNGRYIIDDIPKMEDNDFLEYKNGENNNDDYSNYLINQYQFENKKQKNSMKKIIKESELKALIENKIRAALNELDYSTYYNAGDKAYDKEQYERAKKFYDKGLAQFGSDENGYSGSKNMGSIVTPCPDGIEFSLVDKRGGATNFRYYKNSDTITMIAGGTEQRVNPGEHNNHYLRTNDRVAVGKILRFIKKYNPDSEWLDKNLWIA